MASSECFHPFKLQVLQTCDDSWISQCSILKSSLHHFLCRPRPQFPTSRHDAFTCIHITHNKQKQTHMSPTSWGPPEVEEELSEAGRGQLELVRTGDTVSSTVRSLSGGTPHGLFRSEYLLVSLMSASCDFLLMLHHKTKVLSSRLWK